ncbi:hypothetical protein [Acidimicrobium ferrooxidans]|uniref:hypothetical protein n=1 Tax=Acidimicrobium ferrooxidans TaxID=53635 RepID=UPI00019DE227|nr:hypothetical protein [Acidimicrobium ferrooxidans]
MTTRRDLGSADRQRDRHRRGDVGFGGAVADLPLVVLPLAETVPFDERASVK